MRRTDQTTKHSLVRTRWAAVGAAIAVTFGAVGVGGYNLVNAEISSGDRAVYTPITPCRILDSRPSAGIGRTTPLGANETMSIDVQPSTGACQDLVPADANAVTLNITAVQATQLTFLTLHPTGTPLPNSSTLNPDPTSSRTVNGAITGVNIAGKFNVRNNVGTVHLIVDITGYYESHNHDDRYFTESEADAKFATKQEIAGQETCAAHEFMSAETGAAAALWTGKDVRYTTASTSTPIFFSCAIHPPVGAEFVEFNGYFIDNDPTWAGECALVATRLTNGNIGTIGATSLTTGQSLSVQTTTGAVGIAPIVPDFYSYRLSCTTMLNTIGIVGARITYTFDN